jgi:hypothetical protein
MKTFKKAELDQLFKQMNYLNIAEYQGFCDKHEIPYDIYAEVAGRLKKTSAKDRKKIVLARIRNFLKTGKVQGPTVFAKNVVNFEKLKNISTHTVDTHAFLAHTQWTPIKLNAAASRQGRKSVRIRRQVLLTRSWLSLRCQAGLPGIRTTKSDIYNDNPPGHRSISRCLRS